MGCLLAAYLAKAGQEVILLDHQAERAAFINRKGLKIEGIRGSVRMMVPANPGTGKVVRVPIDRLVC